MGAAKRLEERGFLEPFLRDSVYVPVLLGPSQLLLERWKHEQQREGLGKRLEEIRNVLCTER